MMEYNDKITGLITINDGVYFFFFFGEKTVILIIHYITRVPL